MKRKLKLAVVVLLAMCALVGYAAAQSLYFYFTQTKYEPSQYHWEAPWTVQEVVDYIEATLNVTGSGVQNQPHDYTLVFKNIAPDVEAYILMSFDYAVNWTVGDQSETLVSRSYSGALLVGENVTYSGVFTPTIYGNGNIELTVENIVWAEAEPITWNAVVDNPYPDFVTVADFHIEGASKTYLETGVAVATFSGVGYVDFNLTLPEVGTIFVDEWPIDQEYRYEFGPLTTGGDLTATLTVLGQHG